MNTQNYRLNPTQLLALFCGIVLVLLFAMHYRLGMELADDGAFFLRYAENMLKGEFWVWNLGEAPVWGHQRHCIRSSLLFPWRWGCHLRRRLSG